jgi:uncharacterized membrane protein
MLYMNNPDIDTMAKPVVNITEKQRLVSGITGGLLLAMGIFGFSKSSFRRAVRMTIGSLMIMRASTGYCPVTAMKNERDADKEPGISTIGV